MEVSPRLFMYLKLMLSLPESVQHGLHARSRSKLLRWCFLLSKNAAAILRVISASGNNRSRRRSQPRDRIICQRQFRNSGSRGQDQSIAVRQGRRRSGRSRRVVKRKQSRLQLAHTETANQAKLAENSSSSAFGSFISATTAVPPASSAVQNDSARRL